MDKEQKDTLKVNFANKKIRGTVKGVSFKEGDFHIFYIPSLNLSAYGDSFEEAYEMIRDVVIPDFCNSLVTKPRSIVMNELKRLGWVKNSLLANELSKAAFIDRDGILRQFELSPDTQFIEKEIAVC